MAIQVKKRLPLIHDIEIHQGDSWRLEFQIKLPVLSAFGFDATDLNEATVVAEIRPSPNGELLEMMEIEYIDRDERIFRPWLSAEQTDASDLEGYWDLQVVDDSSGWTRTFYKGSVILNKEITR